MDDNNSDAGRSSASWDNYWAGSASGAALNSEGASHPVLEAFWADFFREFVGKPQLLRVLDIASGTGAVVGAAAKAFRTNGSGITCVDISASALATLQTRFPDADTLESDAVSIDLPSGHFDLVCSQFGIEYAGTEAFTEAFRLLAGGGTLGLLLHARQGGIFAECQRAVSALVRLREIRFIPLALTMFDAAFAVTRGADRVPYDLAVQALLSAYRELEEILRTYGEHVAGDTLLRLYEDVEKIHLRVEHYEPADVQSWLSRLDRELSAYLSRMQSMCAAALDEREFTQLVSDAREQGLDILRAEPLPVSGSTLPIAWLLTAIRTN